MTSIVHFEQTISAVRHTGQERLALADTIG